MAELLRMEGITKQFGTVYANKDINLSIEEGEIHTLLGENGAGKSTLMNILIGLYQPTSGTIWLKGKKVKIDSPKTAVKLGIGMVHQHFMLVDAMTVFENIILGTKKDSSIFIKKEERKKEILELSQKYGLEVDLDKQVNEISVGEQQRVEILKALYRGAELLILDEPTAALTDQEVEGLFSIMGRLTAENKSVIFISHKMREVMAVSDRVTILRDGKNISTFRKEEYDAMRIIADMIGRQISDLYPTRESRIGEEVLRVEDLTVEHPYIANRDLIHQVSFSVHAGEVLGLGGLVGAGRSEVCLALYGMMPVKSGKIFMNQQRVHIHSSADAVRHGISMVSEDRKRYGLNFSWDIQKNIIISNLEAVSRGCFVMGKRIRERAEPYFRDLSIKAPSLGTRVATLSGGNQQKVVIARALNAEPKVIILDEPTKGIDVGSKNEIYQLINQLAATGVAIIIVSSDLPELMAMSDRMVIMAEGRVAGELDKSEAQEIRIMELATKTFRNAQRQPAV